MEKLKIQASARDPQNSNLEILKKSGLIPAVLYGHGIKNQHLALNLNDFEKVLKKAGESTLVDLVTEDGKNHPVLIHDIQLHYLTSKPRHVDFYEVKMTEKLKAKVSLEFTGEAKAVKELGGVLVRVLNEIEVECLPQDLPHNVEVNISSLNAFEDSILIRDLKVDPKVKIISHLEDVVAKVQPPRNIEVELAGPVVEDVSAVEGAAETKPVEGEAGTEVKEAKAETKEAKPEKKKE